MSNRADLLAQIEDKFGKKQSQAGIFYQADVNVEDTPELQGAELASVPALLASARAQANLTLAEVAERLGVTRAAVHHREREGANIEVATLLEQARAMGYEVSITLRHLESGQILTTQVT
jgi:DNA-binding XRE family transcriptional regulator